MRHARWALWGHFLVLSGALALSLAASFSALRQLNTKAIYNDSAQMRGQALTARRPVLLIVIDGLREDAARSMPALRRIAQRGTSARVIAGVPTFSAAAYVTLLTGTGPEASGRRTNEGLFPAALDSLPAQLAVQGRTARALSDEVDWWGTLLPAFTEVRILPESRLLAQAEQRMADSDLLVVHLCGVDQAGHDHGAASEAYREAVRRADEIVARLADRWGDRGVLSVLSDHGHTASGGHGGPEDEVRNTWWVAAGPGVPLHPESQAVSSIDVAPTVAAWLGAPPPADAEGSVRTELIDAAGPVLEQLRLQDRQRVERLNDARGEHLGAQERQRHGERLVRGFGVAFLAAAFAGWLRRARDHRRELGAGAIAGAGVLALAAGIEVLGWGLPSFSSASGPGFIAVRSALLLLAGAAVVLPWPMWRRREPRRGRPFLLGLAGACAVPAAALFVLEGAFASRALIADPWMAVLPLQLWPAAGAGALVALAGWIYLAPNSADRSSEAPGSPSTNGSPRASR